jgi:hypothetical protein
MEEQEQIVMTPEDEAAEEAAFEAGFEGNDVDLDEVAPPTVEETETPEQDAEPEGTETAAEAAPPVTEPEPEFLSKQQFDEVINGIKAEHQRTIDKLFGKLGDVQHKLEQARKEASGISPKARERLFTEFPEFAEILFDGAKAPELTPDPAPSTMQMTAPPVSDEPLAADDPVKLRQDYEKKLLKKDHNDWELVVTSVEFDTFKTKMLKPDEAAELDSSWDAELIGKRLTEFKTWHKAQLAAAQAEKDKQNRLTAAVTPQGIPGTTVIGGTEDEEEAAMMASFGKR